MVVVVSVVFLQYVLMQLRDNQVFVLETRFVCHKSVDFMFGVSSCVHVIHLLHGVCIVL